MGWVVAVTNLGQSARITPGLKADPAASTQLAVTGIRAGGAGDARFAQGRSHVPAFRPPERRCSRGRVPAPAGGPTWPSIPEAAPCKRGRRGEGTPQDRGLHASKGCGSAPLPFPRPAPAQCPAQSRTPGVCGGGARRGRTEGARNGRPPHPHRPGPQGQGSPPPLPLPGRPPGGGAARPRAASARARPARCPFKRPAAPPPRAPPAAVRPGAGRGRRKSM